MKSANYAITTTKSEVVTAEPLTRYVWIHVLGAGTVYLGDTTVTSATGFKTEKNAIPQMLIIPAGENLFALTASGTEDLRILVQGD